jgi:hypothetical protein
MSDIDCFMVKEFWECWNRDGTPNVGAMIFSSHGLAPDESGSHPFPHLSVMMPGGWFCIDCPETSNPNSYWQRSGEAPMITVAPSINIVGAWHGWLRDGKLSPA